MLLNGTLLKDVQELETLYKVGEQSNELLRKDLLLQQREAETAQHRFWLIAAIVVCVLMLIIPSFVISRITPVKSLRFS